MTIGLVFLVKKIAICAQLTHLVELVLNRILKGLMGLVKTLVKSHSIQILLLGHVLHALIIVKIVKMVPFANYV